MNLTGGYLSVCFTKKIVSSKVIVFFLLREMEIFGTRGFHVNNVVERQRHIHRRVKYQQNRSAQSDSR